MEFEVESGLIGLLAGVPFGYVLQKTGMSDPNNIRAQLEIPPKSYTMMKTFLSALATGTMAIAIGEQAGFIGRCPKPFAPRADILGGLLLGSGMYITGACPGTVMTQFGTFVPGAVSVLAGGISGALAIGLTHNIWSKYLLPANSVGKTVDGHFGVPLLTVALPASAVIATFLYFLEQRKPETMARGRNRTNFIVQTYHEIKEGKWNPYVGGLVIGLLQLPMFYLLGFGLGASSPYTTIAGYLATCTGDGPNTYFSNFMGHTKDFARILVDLGMIVGGYLALTAPIKCRSPRKKSSKSNDSLRLHVKQFFGGFLLVSGARIAGGCPSGHGLTGVAQMSIGSIIATSAMFAGGYATSAIYGYMSSLDYRKGKRFVRSFTAKFKGN